ncbi:MAG: cell wall-binding repeat-containing protein [Frankiaceae bacterium]|nr:cell wall-binding repeat-containing protein [Frankiaceae bacterium]
MTHPRSTPALVLIVLLVAAGLPALMASAAEVQRLSGSGRYETAAAVSASFFDPGVPVAYVATGLSFPDALAGGAAAAAKGGPVLLVDRDAVPDATEGELERLRPGRIVVLGGESAVSAAVLGPLDAFTDGEVTRLSGPDRYATAAAISAATFAPGVRNVHITTGAGFADALAAGPAAGAQNSPVLRGPPGAVPAATATELRRLQPAAITVLGGATAVWPAVEAALERYAPVTRLFGPDRSATSAAVARVAFPDRVPAVFLAAGGAFPDALAGGPVAALTPGPLMLVPKDCIPAVVQAQIDRLAPERVVVLGGTAAVGIGVASGTPCPGGAAAPPASVSGGPASTFVVEAPDYASEVHGDPWDYANTDDIHVGTPQMSDGGAVAGGLLTYRTATAFPWMDPIPYLPGSMPLERDGPRAPVDTARYTHLSVRMSASQAGAGILVWSICDWSRSSSCQGAKGVAVQAGWHTYDVLLEGTDPNLRAPWSGSALQLRFIPNDKTDVDIAVDWMRLHGAAAPARFTLAPVAPGAANEVLWDSDGDLTNNTAGAPGWGVLGTTTGTAYDFPVATFPPGQYRLYTRASGRTGAYTEALHVLPRPRVVVDSPSLRSGDDYATAVRGNPWDFAGLDDVGRHENVCNSQILDGGVLAANNCGAEIDNPYFFLPTAGAIDGSTWHRLHLRLRYDGPFGLTGGPTGGAVARLIWFVAGDGAASDQNVHDIVVHPGWQDIAVDLRTDPPSAVVDETQSGPRIGWAGQTITSLRLDPNEDVSSRQWYVDSVRLTREDAARGAYDVRFRETSGLGGTAQVFLDRDRSGTDGVQVAAQPVVGGPNTARIALPGSLPEGRYWPYVVVTGPSGSTVEYAAAPVHLTR